MQRDFSWRFPWMILFIQAGTFQGLVSWLIAEPACQFLSTLFSFFVLYVPAGSYLSLIIKEVEEEMEWLWMPIHSSFFGQQVPSASLCASTWPGPTIHPALPKPSQFHWFTGRSVRFLSEAKIKNSHPHPSSSPAQKEILCYVYALPREGRAG